MKTKYFVFLIPLLLIFLVHGATSPVQSPATNQFSITFISESHQAVGGNCYNAQIHVRLSWIGNGTFTVGISNFYLYSTGTNLVLSNSTNYGQPNNQISFIVLFPSVNVTLILSFTAFCIPAGLTGLQVWLFYFDGANTLKTRIV